MGGEDIRMSANMYQGPEFFSLSLDESSTLKQICYGTFYSTSTLSLFYCYTLTLHNRHNNSGCFSLS